MFYRPRDLFDGFLNFEKFSGMKVGYKIFPEGFLTGSPPPGVTETLRTPGGPTEKACKEQFDQDDLEKISIYLDNALCDKSCGSK